MSKPRVLRFGIQSLDKLIGSVNTGWPLLQTTDLVGASSLIRKLKDKTNPVSRYLRKRPALNSLLKRCASSVQEPQVKELVYELNELLKDNAFFDQDRFKSVRLSQETKELRDQSPGDKDHGRFNRMLLEDAYQPEISKTKVDYGIQLSEPDDGSNDLPLTSSVCLTGPDGTGKSVFALHMTSHYLADCLQLPVSGKDCPGSPRVLYISTDLTYKMALKAWNNFALDRPFERREPLIELKEGRKRIESPGRRIELKQYFPSADTSTKSVVNYLEGRAYKNSTDLPDSAEVCFVDLASRTAGDDWGFVHRLLSNLQEFGGGEPRHLVVLDAVEGFETLVGDVNAFGEKSTRRSRIAQVMRLSTGKCHVVFVVEEGRDERLPEEFVTDVVIRLRNVGTPRYLRRTVEVEKARGQWHIRGQHPFAIRDGRGSTTGTQDNADEPEVKPSCLFDARDFIDARDLVCELNQRKTLLAGYLLNRFAPDTRQLLKKYKANKSAQRPSDELILKLVEELNKLLTDPSLYEKGRLEDVSISGETKELSKHSTQEAGDLIRLNRTLLEKAYPKGIATSQEHQSYVHVFPSLNYISREIMIDEYNPREKPPEGKFAAFGIQYLDNMLDGRGEKAERAGQPATALQEGHQQNGKAPRWNDYDTRGLPCGTTTALIGDSLTQKSQLGRAFLSRAFYGYAMELAKNICGTAGAEARAVSASGGETAKGTTQVRQQGSAIREELKPVPEDYQPVTLMFTTQQVGSEILVNEFYSWLEDRDEIEKVLSKGDKPDATKKWRVFEDELKKRILCRRFEIHDIPGPILMHIFQRNIEKAQRLMFGLEDHEPLPSASIRYQQSWRIRVVIDDLNSFRNMFPEMREDPLMLPSLLSMLGREGVTTLIIDTQTSGSPELSITERFDSSVRELVKHRIYTWRLPFYGENRVAIGLIPPISHEYGGIIRELRWETRDESRPNRSLIVDPHFELYMGLEKGQPRPVPLEVRLYAETPNFKKYIEAEERFFREVFTPVFPPANQATPCVITWADVTEYDALRDSSRLQRDTRLDHTTILQVDEFWWLRRFTKRRAGAFRPQWDYLNSVTAPRRGGHVYPDLVADPFEVFQPPTPEEKDSSLQSDPGQEPGARQGSSRGQVELNRRLDFYDEKCGYDFKDEKTRQHAPLIDRVPFTWDFGFLLCNETAWEEAFDQEIGQGSRVVAELTKAERMKVKEVWDRLCKANEEPRQTTTPVSWREFLAASKVVAEYQSYRTSRPAIAFDFTMLSPESFSCLILEMWVSEIHISLSKDSRIIHREKIKNEILERVRQRRWHWEETTPNDKLDPRTLLVALEREKDKSLGKILDERRRGPAIGGYSLELYKVWLLLIETLNFAELVDPSSHLTFEFKSRDVSPLAVSARHWYKTASKFMDSLTPEQIESNWVPVRLPGHFSVRSDWFLAVAGGSRSNRLADHALDLLSSQRANVTRLQEGIGLPTRKLFDKDEDRAQLRTRLVSFPKKGKPLANVEYEKLREIGATVLFGVADFVDANSLIRKLKNKRDPVSKYLSSKFARDTKKLLDEYNYKDPPGQALLKVVVDELNGLLKGDLLYEVRRFKKIKLSRETKALLKQSTGSKGSPGQSLREEDRTRLNRMLLEDAYPDAVVKNSFYWLWRSGIWAYNRHSRVWHKWLNRALLKWHSWRQRFGSDWTSGFEVYDLLSRIEFEGENKGKLEKLELESWKHFHELRDILIAELQQVSTSSEARRSMGN